MSSSFYKLFFNVKGYIWFICCFIPKDLASKSLSLENMLVKNGQSALIFLKF